MASNISPQSITINNFSSLFSVVHATTTSEYNNYSPFHRQQATLAFFISALLNIIQLMPHSPFDTHPRIMKIAIISFFLYCIGCIVESMIITSNNNHLPQSIPPHVHSNVIQGSVRLLGYFSIASMAFIFLRSDSVWPPLLLFFTFLILMMLHCFLSHRQAFNSESYSNIHNCITRTGGIQNSGTLIRTLSV